MSIRILIVDRCRIVREGVRLFLACDQELEIVGEAANGQEALEQVSLLRPDLVLLDVQLPSQDGMTTIAAIRRQLPKAQVVVLSSVLEPTSIAGALRVGAIGYLSKNIRAGALRTAVKAAAAGQIQFPPPASAYLLDEAQPSEFRQSPTS